MSHKLCFVVLGVTVALAASVVAHNASAGTLYMSATLSSPLISYSGPGVAGGGVWNNLTAASGSGLLDSGGGSTSVSYTTTAAGPIDGGGAADLAMFNGFVYTATSALFDINGLAGSYNLYLYSQVGDGSPYASDLSVNGSPIQTVTNTNSAFTPGVNYTEFVGIAATGGTLAITFSTHGDSPFAVINGFQLVSVPEPSSIILAGIGLIGAALVARRHRKR